MKIINQDEETQKSLADGIKRVLSHQNGVSGNEFRLFLDILRQLQIFTMNKELPKEIAAIVVKQSGIEKPFEVRVKVFVSVYNVDFSPLRLQTRRLSRS